MKIEIPLKKELKQLVDFKLQCGMHSAGCNGQLKLEDDCISVVKYLERYDRDRKRENVVLCQIPYPDGYKRIFESPVQEIAVIEFDMPVKYRNGRESIRVEGGKDSCFMKNFNYLLGAEFSFQIRNAEMHVVFKPREFNKENRSYKFFTLKPKEYSRIIAHVLNPVKAFSIVLTLPSMCLR